MKESTYQGMIIKKLRDVFPGCVILKNDPNYIQGIPDLTILYGDYWAMLEVKVSKKAYSGPNQNHYVEKLSSMSFAAFIYPENEEVVLYELQCAFGRSR